jgi:signal recognition particle subunit SRP54
VDEGELGKVESMIHSMTRQERTKPDIIDKSRASRIANGCGRKVKDVTDLVGRFRQMREMMGNLGAPGGLLSRMGGMGGGMPAGGMDPSALMAGAGAPGFGMPAGGGRMRSSKDSQRKKDKRKQSRKSRQKGRKKKKK